MFFFTVSCFWLAFVTASNLPHLRRQSQFANIKEYEIVRIGLVDHQYLEFDAFEQHFRVELTINAHFKASEIRHTQNPTIRDGKDPFMTARTDSCHYFAKVVDAKSSGAVSLCDKRGIRGNIHLEDDTIFIKPAAYYLDTDREEHSFDDEYIVYKESKVERANVKYGAIDFSNGKQTKSSVSEMSAASTRLNSGRKLLAWNNGDSKMESLIMIDPAQIAIYAAMYSNWYEQLTADMLDMMNAVASIYYDNGDQGWPTAIGHIHVKVVEFLIIEEWNGAYTGLEPREQCSDYLASNCVILGDQWLDQISRWLYSYNSDYDNVVMIHGMEMADYAVGWGYVGTMCQGHMSVNNVWNYDPDELYRIVSHEIGHNIGANHDGQGVWRRTCASSDGIMGYSPIRPDYFSQCSLIDIENYFTQSGGLTCLSDEPSTGIISNYDDDGGTSVSTTSSTSTSTTSSTTTSTQTPTCTYYPCVQIRGLALDAQGHDFKGSWQFGGCNGPYGYYSRVLPDGDRYYLYKETTRGYWYMSTVLNQDAGWAHCDSSITDPLQCGNNWWILRNRGWRFDSTSPTTECASAFKADSVNAFVGYLEDEEVPCVPENAYNEHMCVSDLNQSLSTIFEEHLVDTASAHVQFSLFAGYCMNERAVYYYTHVDVSNHNLSTTYYLHYNHYYRFSDDNATSTRWIISKDDVSEASLKAACHHDDLLQCGVSTWMVSVVVDGDSRQQQTSHNIGVHNDECPLIHGEQIPSELTNSPVTTFVRSEEMEEESDAKYNTMVIIIVAVSVVVAVCVIVLVVIMCAWSFVHGSKEADAMEEHQVHQENQKEMASLTAVDGRGETV